MQRTFMYFAAFTGMGTLFVAAIVVAALVAGTASPTTGTTPSASAEPTAAASQVAEGPIGEITITAFDLGFEPAMVHVDAPGTYTVNFVNDGGIFHDVTFADGTKIEADAGESASGTVTIPNGGLAFVCNIPGHADAGMKGSVTVHGETTAGGNAGGDGNGPLSKLLNVSPQAMASVDERLIRSLVLPFDEKLIGSRLSHGISITNTAGALESARLHSHIISARESGAQNRAGLAAYPLSRRGLHFV